MNKYDSCQDELIMFSYLCGTVFVAAFCLFTGDLQKGVLFLHHQVRRVSGWVNSYCDLPQGVGGVSKCEIAGAGFAPGRHHTRGRFYACYIGVGPRLTRAASSLFMLKAGHCSYK